MYWPADVATTPVSPDTPDDLLSVCQSCKAPLHDPQMFPCLHAFCRDCLHGGPTQPAGTRVCCPLCNTALIIPTSSGLGLGAATPGWVFLHKLLKLREIFGDESGCRATCDVCDGAESWGAARALTTSKMSTRCCLLYTSPSPRD